MAGHNGAGKTTLFRLLSGLDVPSAGRVRVVGGDPVRAAGRVTFAPAHLPLAQLRARNYLYALQVARGQPRYAADAALERLGMRQPLTPMLELSHGNR